MNKKIDLYLKISIVYILDKKQLEPNLISLLQFLIENGLVLFWARKQFPFLWKKVGTTKQFDTGDLMELSVANLRINARLIRCGKWASVSQSQTGALWSQWKWTAAPTARRAPTLSALTLVPRPITNNTFTSPIHYSTPYAHPMGNKFILLLSSPISKAIITKSNGFHTYILPRISLYKLFYFKHNII